MSDLAGLGVSVVNRHDAEEQAIHHIDEAIFASQRRKLQLEFDSIHSEIETLSKISSSVSLSFEQDWSIYRDPNMRNKRLEFLKKKISTMELQWKELHVKKSFEEEGMMDGVDMLIRTGELTPFELEQRKKLQKSNSGNLQRAGSMGVSFKIPKKSSFTMPSNQGIPVSNDKTLIDMVVSKDTAKRKEVKKTGKSNESDYAKAILKSKRKISEKESDLPKKKGPISKTVIHESDDDLNSFSSSEDILASDLENSDDEQVDSVSKTTVELPDVVLSGLSVTGDLYEKLFPYQRTGIRWLWELHQQQVGGIIGDEMGLGKTMQIVAFLGSLHRSKLYSTSIIVCPGSVLRHWVNEFRRWYPMLEPILLHHSEASSTEETIKSIFLNNTKRNSQVVVTTYDNCRIFQDLLASKPWGYLVLDEGHKIRNPDAAITLAVKRFSTPHRIVMSGAPIQNNLKELWSLFDFIFPGKLGTLPLFEAEFCLPITKGGYSNASPLQVQIASRTSLLLRSLIEPHFLRRIKADVGLSLPNQSEQILFCKLSQTQRNMYKEYLSSDDVRRTLSNRSRVSRNHGTDNSLFKIIDKLRKICNHPSLALLKDDFNSYSDEDSGKIMVLLKVVTTWKAEGNRVLIFAQTRQMLDLIEAVVKLRWSYLRLDGTTPVSTRQTLIDRFNGDNTLDVFLLTTKAGGLGINLTGANRVLIFDPDWNPATDFQAKDRVYRIGQTRNVVIYRLVTRGTIEEKIYQRQIFKQLLTNRVLKDPSQKRYFSSAQLGDLFTLEDEPDLIEEDSDIDEEEAKDLDGGKKEEPKMFSIFSHDSIVEPEVINDAYTKAYVDQVTNDKLKILAANRSSMSGSCITTPTWTGKSGKAGMHSSSKPLSSGFVTLMDAHTASIAAPASSSNLLAMISQRNSSASLHESSANKNNVVEKVSIIKPQNNVTLDRLIAYLSLHSFGVTSDQLIHDFHGNREVPAEEAAKFREILRSIAFLKDKKWVLK